MKTSSLDNLLPFKINKDVVVENWVVSGVGESLSFEGTQVRQYGKSYKITKTSSCFCMARRGRTRTVIWTDIEELKERYTQYISLLQYN